MCNFELLKAIKEKGLTQRDFAAVVGSGTGKIDPLMAMNPEARMTKSIYETEGVKVF